VNFTLRAAQPADLDDLLRLARGFAQRAGRPLTADAEHVRASLFGPVPRAHVLIAHTAPAIPHVVPSARPPDAAGLAIGFAVWHYDFDLLTGLAGIYLDDLHIDADHLGQGISLAFFTALARRAVTEGCRQLRWSPSVGSGTGVSLYRSLSAIPVAAWTSQTLTGEALHALAG
jgi:GNAT superfamily N-acetyltransferase